MIMLWADQGRWFIEWCDWCQYLLLPGQHPPQEECTAVLLRRVEADSLSSFCTLDEYIMQKALVSALMRVVGIATIVNDKPPFISSVLLQEVKKRSPCDKWPKESSRHGIRCYVGIQLNFPFEGSALHTAKIMTELLYFCFAKRSKRWWLASFVLIVWLLWRRQ